MRKKIIVLTVVLSILGSIFATSHMYAELSESSSSSHLAQLYLFNTILTYLRQGYVEEIDPQVLIEGAINGMLNQVDPYTYYMDPQQYSQLLSDYSGSFGGLGMEITITPEDNTLTVVAPIEGTPAEKRGIKTRDKIIAINGESTKDMNIYDAVSKMRGEPGTNCTITIWRNGIDEPFDVTITRAIIDVNAVRYSFMLTDEIGYLRLIRFSIDSTKELLSALDQLSREGMKGLILDLRGNPGGPLDTAVDTASIFLPRGELVVYIEGRDGKNHKDFYSPGGETYSYMYGYDRDYTQIPMVILVNEASASASEIVAGALQYNDRALIIGENTFGKALVQSLIPLPEGGSEDEPAALKMTIAHYYTPSGNLIQDTGILPDIPLEYPQHPFMASKLVSEDFHRRYAEYYSDTHPTNAVSALEKDTLFADKFADFILENDFHFYSLEEEKTLPNNGEEFVRAEIKKSEEILKRMVMRELIEDLLSIEESYYYWQEGDQWIQVAVQEMEGML